MRSSGTLRLSFASRSFSSHLASRILAFASASSLGAVYAACSSTSGGSVTTTSSSHATSGTGGSRSSSSAGGAPTGGAPAATSGLVGFDAGVGEIGPPPNGPACIDWPEDAGACPTDPAVVVFILDEHGCMDGGVATQEASNIVSGPTMVTDGGIPEGGDPDAAPVPGTVQCCYIVSYQYCVGGGRPYSCGASATLAPVVVGPAAAAGGYAVTSSGGAADLTADERAMLATAWTDDGRAEHASIASFARFALALLAHGAPAGLVELAHRAAGEEVRHARLCFGLASSYADDRVGPGAFPLGDVHVPATLAELAVATVHEACVNETISAVLAAEQLGRATDPAVRAALAEIVPDEARHAELGWRTVAWAIDRGGEEVRAAVERAFAEALSGTFVDASGALEGLEAHGRLDAATSRAVTRAALDQVIIPAARALLARCSSSPRTHQPAHANRIEA